MNNLDMKNIIVLKNLPSNIIDEAIVILKNNKIKKRSDTNKNIEEDINNSIVNEAQNVITEYIERIELNKKEKINEKKVLLKYKKLQIITILFGILLVVSCLISFIK